MVHRCAYKRNARRMTRKITLADVPADDVTAVRPERYYDYVYETYGKAFRSGEPGTAHRHAMSRLTGLSAFVSATLSQMPLFHRIVVVALLACVPFQAAAGATGLACPNGAHHSDSSIALADDHGATAPHQHRAPDASEAHDHAVDDASPGSDGPGKCSLCNECCFSAAPV